MARGDFTMAENYLREALSLGEQVEDARTLCTVYLRWGKLRLTQHGADAQSFFQRTLEIAQRVGLRVEEAEAYFGLAQVAAREGDSILARQHGEASRISYQAIGHTMTKTLDMWLSKMA